MGFSLKGLLFKDAEDAPVEKNKEDIKKAATIAPSISSGRLPHNETLVAPTIDGLPPSGTDYNRYLLDKLKETNQPGPDFFEFSEALEALVTLPISEEQKYQVTYPTYKSMGVDADKLISSAGIYLKRIEEEEKDFNAELSATRKKEVDDKAKLVEELNNKNIELTRQIGENNVKIQSLNNEMNTASFSLQGEESQFHNKAGALKSKINDQINKINLYLKK